MNQFTPAQLRFPTIAGFTVRGDFDGGAMSTDFGPLLLHGTDRQTGLISRLASAIRDQRHASYIDHSLSDLLRQRVFQTACGYADGNDANSLRHDPVFKLAAERAPLDTGNALASGPTFSRLENAMTRKDIYRLAQAFVDAFVASYATPPAVIVLDMDHSEDRIHGQQELAFYNHHYRSHCYLPLFLFEGLSGKLITAVLRPGKRPTGRENAAIIGRVVRRLRRAWPDTHILLRGDSHFANPELMALCEDDDQMDFLFGLAGNRALTPKATPLLDQARTLHGQRCDNARRFGQAKPAATRLYEDIDYQAGSLVARVAGGPQGRSDEPGRQPALRRDLAYRSRAGAAVPGFVLRARSGRELHQGDQERPRQRPHLRPRLPRQPPAPVLRLRRLQPHP